jgi:hypothetical protein
MTVAIRKVDHFLDPGTDFRRKRQRICKAEGFVEQLQQLLSPFLDLSGLGMNCGLRHFTTPEQGQVKPLPPLGAALHPRLEYHIPGRVYTSVSTVSE